MVENRLISHEILHVTTKYYISMERGESREASDGNQNHKKLKNKNPT
jgi:hypothetical protein